MYGDDIVMNYCRNCSTLLKNNNNKHCSNKCQKEYEYCQYIIQWKIGLKRGLRGQYQLSQHIRRYIFEKYNYACGRCGWNKINPYTGLLPLEVEHLEGNYENNIEENLIVQCPNCHSLTSTYKGANVNHGRLARRKYYK